MANIRFDQKTEKRSLINGDKIIVVDSEKLVNGNPDVSTIDVENFLQHTVTYKGPTTTGTVILDPDAIPVEGKVFNEYDSAAAYISSKSPTADNRWTLEIHGGTYSDKAYIPFTDFVGVGKQPVFDNFKLFHEVNGVASLLSDINPVLKNVQITKLAEPLHYFAEGSDIFLNLHGCKLTIHAPFYDTYSYLMLQYGMTGGELRFRNPEGKSIYLGRSFRSMDEVGYFRDVIVHCSKEEEGNAGILPLADGGGFYNCRFLQPPVYEKWEYIILTNGARAIDCTANSTSALSTADEKIYTSNFQGGIIRNLNIEYGSAYPYSSGKNSVKSPALSSTPIFPGYMGEDMGGITLVAYSWNMNIVGGPSNFLKGTVTKFILTDTAEDAYLSFSAGTGVTLICRGNYSVARLGDIAELTYLGDNKWILTGCSEQPVLIPEYAITTAEGNEEYLTDSDEAFITYI